MESDAFAMWQFLEQALNEFAEKKKDLWVK